MDYSTLRVDRVARAGKHDFEVYETDPTGLLATRMGRWICRWPGKG
jgi:hypothetical protein